MSRDALQYTREYAVPSTQAGDADGARFGLVGGKNMWCSSPLVVVVVVGVGDRRPGWDSGRERNVRCRDGSWFCFGAALFVMVFVIFGWKYLIVMDEEVRITGLTHGQSFVSWRCCPFR